MRNVKLYSPESLKFDTSPICEGQNFFGFVNDKKIEKRFDGNRHVQPREQKTNTVAFTNS